MVWSQPQRPHSDARRLAAGERAGTLDFSEARETPPPAPCVLDGIDAFARIAPLLGIEPRMDLPSADQLILASVKETR